VTSVNGRLSKKGEVRNAVRIALQAGYTHIDCAQIYGNETEVGQGIKDWGGDRSKIWVTSKVVSCNRPLDGVNCSCGITSIVLLMSPKDLKRL
jgi:diketogulonate reductase-like aldo/keto reductase